MCIRHAVFALFISGIIATSFSGCQRKSDNVTIGVTNAEVEDQLQHRMDYFISLYGSKENLEKAAGKKIAQIKEEYREVIVAQIIAERAEH